jgi:hypothetical protein
MRLNPGGPVGLDVDEFPWGLELGSRPWVFTGLGEGRADRALAKLGLRSLETTGLGFGAVVTWTKEREKEPRKPGAFSSPHKGPEVVLVHTHLGPKVQVVFWGP